MKGESILIRPYQQKDKASVISLHESSHAEIEANVPEGFFDDINDIESRYKDGTFLVAEVDNEIVGMAALRKEARNAGEIMRMRVHPAFQRKGIGTALVNALEEKAIDLGLKELFLLLKRRLRLSLFTRRQASR